MSTTRTTSTSSASTSDRGNWRGRGRGDSGRGRGGYRGDYRGGQPRQQGENVIAEGTSQDRREPKPPLTHFLALPIGHHVDLRDRMSTFSRSLLDSVPAIPGLDESIVISPRRLHLTLGVMSLTDTPSTTQNSPPRSIESALALLHRLRPRIMEFLAGEKLRVGLTNVDIMKPDHGDLAKAHVMWVGPPREGEDAQRLKRVAEFVNREFMKAGLVVDEKRPLKLHCTVLNTTYRRPRPRGARQPFSYAAVLSSAALQSIEQPEAVVATSVQPAATSANISERPRGRTPIQVDFGEWTVDEIQVCKMGSWGPEGEYVSVGHITLS